MTYDGEDCSKVVHQKGYGSTRLIYTMGGETDIVIIESFEGFKEQIKDTGVLYLDILIGYDPSEDAYYYRDSDNVISDATLKEFWMDYNSFHSTEGTEDVLFNRGSKEIEIPVN